MTGSRNIKGSGIILKSKNYSESDKLLTVITREFGKLTILVKSGRTVKSKKRGYIELFNFIKFSANFSHGIYIASEIEGKSLFPSKNRDLKMISVAYFMVEVFDRLAQFAEINSKQYEVLFGFLSKLETSKNLKKLREDFIFETLVVFGFWPHDKQMQNHDLVLKNFSEKIFHSAIIGKRLLENYLPNV